MGEFNEKELTNKAIKDVIKAKKEIKEEKGQRIEEMAKELGIKL